MTPRIDPTALTCTHAGPAEKPVDRAPPPPAPIAPLVPPPVVTSVPGTFVTGVTEVSPPSHPQSPHAASTRMPAVIDQLTIEDPALARARAGLAEAVRRWPHLVEPEAQERLAVYVEEQGENEMARKKADEKIQTAIRLEGEIIARLDAIASKLSRPGLVVTRSDAIRIALLTGLGAIEKEK